MSITLLQISIHQAEGKEILFYAFVGLLLFLAIIRQLFPKYSLISFLRSLPKGMSDKWASNFITKERRDLALQ